MNVPDALLDQARALLSHCRSAGLKLAVAESCTGGLLCACLTEIPGSSDVFDRGFVAYSYAAKTDLLGVPKLLVEQHGAVSEQVARAMAEGALARSAADVAVAVTGIAGPGGGTPEKPVGLVHFAAARRGQPVRAERRLLQGDRTAVRLASAAVALELLGQAAS
ncbi:MAG TPA: CinA family protein [Myxococcaceae bacterium]|jgi:nicotinamide-nucleotide amidase|nr:CinA family protein [Myxococcaceae bacterium]